MRKFDFDIVQKQSSADDCACLMIFDSRKNWMFVLDPKVTVKALLGMSVKRIHLKAISSDVYDDDNDFPGRLFLLESLGGN